MKNAPHTSGLLIDQAPSLKEFSLADILSVASGLLLTPAGAVHGLVGYLTAQDARAANTATGGRDAKTCLEEQLPFLKAVDYMPLHNAFRNRGAAAMNDLLQTWLEIQERKYGNAHYLMPLSRWQRRRNSHKL